MHSDYIKKYPLGVSRAALLFLQAIALALVVSLAVPARAEDDRAVKTKVAVIYPEIAKRMRVQGIVYVEATVDAGGKVTAAKAVSGNLILAPAAEDSVRKWTFESGTGVSKVKVDITFVMSH